MKAPGLSFDLDNMIWQAGAQRTPVRDNTLVKIQTRELSATVMLITSQKLDATSPHKFNS